MRSPYSLDDLASVVGLLIEGFSLQWVRDGGVAGDDGPVTESLTCRTAQMLFDQMTEPDR